MIQPLFLIELNEVNFAFIKHYASRGHLPTLSSLVEQHGIITTSSEQEYEHVEPWIQWVTAHTGRPFSEHRVFRLGDIGNADVQQIWEALEAKGLKVGALSPMNACNRLKSAAFFVPDPWTQTHVAADGATRAMYSAIRQAVQENAAGRLTLASVVMLLRGFLKHVQPRRWYVYAQLVSRARNRPWIKAIVLDRLLAETFISLVNRTSPHFASLFLNGGAHVQHHYMYNSSAYNGERRNPSWYVDRSEDPVFEIYRAYDQIVEDLLQAIPGARFIIATGLHQDPYPSEVFYWRLLDHPKFLKAAGIPFVSVEPLMSRDFLLRCASKVAALEAAALLESARVDARDDDVFVVDNRGDSLFCTLAFPHDIDPTAILTINDRRIPFRDSVAFVALKNGHHNPLGYVIDTAKSKSSTSMPLAELYYTVLKHFEAQLPQG